MRRQSPPKVASQACSAVGGLTPPAPSAPSRTRDDMQENLEQDQLKPNAGGRKRRQDAMEWAKRSSPLGPTSFSQRSRSPIIAFPPKAWCRTWKSETAWSCRSSRTAIAAFAAVRFGPLLASLNASSVRELSAPRRCGCVHSSNQRRNLDQARRSDRPAIRSRCATAIFWQNGARAPTSQPQT